MNLSPEDVEDILRVLDSTDYDELHLATERFVLTLRREAGGWTQEHQLLGSPHVLGREHPTAPGPTVDASAVGTAADPPATTASDEGVERGAPEQSGPQSEGLRAVLAPLPGVFYRAPKPGAAPFVEVGDRVEPDTVVAILETMKLMNAVHAGCAGTVAAIVVANAAPAELGAPLLWIRPDAPA